MYFLEKLFSKESSIKIRSPAHAETDIVFHENARKPVAYSSGFSGTMSVSARGGTSLFYFATSVTRKWGNCPGKDLIAPEKSGPLRPRVLK